MHDEHISERMEAEEEEEEDLGEPFSEEESPERAAITQRRREYVNRQERKHGRHLQREI